MEILKGFVFDIQRFTGYTLAANATSTADGNLTDESSPALTLGGTGTVVATISSGVLKWAGTVANDTLVITLADGSLLKSVELGTGADITSVSILTGATNGIVVPKASLPGLSLSNQAATVTGAYEITGSTTITGDVTLKNGASITFNKTQDNAFTVGSSSTAKIKGASTDAAIVATLTAGNEITVTKGVVNVNGAGTVKIDAAAAVTVNTTNAANGDYAVASDDKITVASGKKAEISVADQNITLKSGDFATVVPETGATADKTVAINATDTITVAGQYSFTNGTVGTYTSGTVAAVTSGEMTLLGAATYNVSGHEILYKIVNADTDTKINGVTGAVTGITAGESVTNADTLSISVNGTTFTKDAKATSLEVGYVAIGDGHDIGVTNTTGGTILTGVGTIYSTTANKKVETSGTSASVAIAFAAGTPTVSKLSNGEKVRIYDSATNYVEYEAVSSNLVKRTDKNTSATPTYYSGLTDGALFSYATFSISGNLVAGDDIRVKDVSTTTYYNAIGVGGLDSTSSDVVASVTVNGTSKTVNVTGTFSNKIDLTGAENATVAKDAKGTTVFQTKDGTFNVAEGKGFKSTNSVISDATGTITTATGSITASGSVNVDTSAIKTGSAKLVEYVAGTGLSDVSVKYNGGNTIKITESANNTNTVVALNAGSTNVEVSGLDDGASITGATTNDIYTTAASGTFTFNGKAWTLAGDDDGADFTVNTAAAGQIGTINGLVKEAKVSTTSKLTGENITVGTTTFNAVNAKSGATFTSLANSGAATITLSTAKDSVVIGTNTYEVESMGGTADGIVIGNDTLAALNDGDKIKVYATATPTVYREYEVSGNTMVVTYNNAGAVSTTSYTLSDSSDPGFTVGSAINGTTINGDTGTTVDVKFGTSATAATNQATNSLTDGLYVSADGTMTSSDKNALAKVSKADDLVTYVSSSSKGQEVSVSSSANNSDNWSITTGAGKDLITFAANTDASIDAGAGDDTIVVNGRGSKVVSTGDGKNTVRLNGSGDINLTLGAGKDEVTDLGTTGDVVVTANGGNNDINMAAATGDVTITGGSGNDTIKAASTDNVVSGGGGKDVFDITTTSVKVSDYTFGDDVIQVAAGTTLAPAMLTGDGTVSVAAGQVADISANAGDFYAADIKIGTNKALHTAWAKEGGSNINTTAFSNDALVKGDADGVNTLYTGAGDDVIYSYADNDSVYGGEGKDTITLQAKGEGRVVGIATNSSKDTVSGFTAGFSDSDSIFMVDGDVSGVKTTLESVSGGTGTFTFKDGAASLTLGSVGVNTVTGAAEVLVNGFKLAALATGATAKVDDANYADMYMGDKSAVDFSAVESDLFVDLSNDLSGSSAGAKYVGVNAVTGGNGNSTLMGTGSADYIVATSGKTSLFGGAGSDTLVGNSNSADVFFFGDGTGKNTVTNFTTQGNDNADTLQVYSNITGAKLNGSNVEISTADGSKAILTSQNANSKLNVVSNGVNIVAKVGSASSANDFKYDKDVTYYGGGSASDKITFSSGYTDNAEIWMNGIQGKAYASIDVVDGTNTSGSLIVAGDSASQSIIGGKGDTSLWGGAGSATDTLKSSAGGKTMFWWGAGDGNDVVVSASADDSVNLYNVKLSDIDGANSSITNSGVVLALNDGSKLTMQTTRNMNFTIEGQSWTADQSSKEWKQNS